MVVAARLACNAAKLRVARRLGSKPFRHSKRRSPQRSRKATRQLGAAVSLPNSNRKAHRLAMPRHGVSNPPNSQQRSNRPNRRAAGNRAAGHRLAAHLGANVNR